MPKDIKFSETSPTPVESVVVSFAEDNSPRFTAVYDTMINDTLVSPSVHGRSGAPVIKDGAFVGYVQGEMRVTQNSKQAVTVVEILNPGWFSDATLVAPTQKN